MRNNFSRSERWQVILTAVQTFALVVATAAAIFIGIQQNAINQRLYELNFVVAMDVVYDSNEKRLNIFNKGKENIWLWGNRLDAGPKTIEQRGRLITPGGSYYILAESMEREVLEKVGANGDLRIPFEVYLKDGSSRPYTAEVILFIQVAEGKMTVHTQTVSIDQVQW